MKGTPPFAVYHDRDGGKITYGIVDSEGAIIVTAYNVEVSTMRILSQSLTANPKMLIPISKCPKCGGGMFGGICRACDITKIPKVKK